MLQMFVWSLSLYNIIEFKVPFFYAKSRTCSFIVFYIEFPECFETIKKQQNLSANSKIINMFFIITQKSKGEEKVWIILKF